MSGLDEKYQRAVIFSGGGTRFAIYCGMYAAMEELGVAPDLVIGACGGSIATAVINSFGTNRERKEYLQSTELYEYIRNTKLTAGRKLHRIGLYCLRKMLCRENAPYIENIFDGFLVDYPQDISKLLPSLTAEMNTNVRSIIIGANVLFEKTETGEKRNGRKLYKKVLFTDKETARKIDCKTIEITSSNFQSSAVESSIKLVTDISMPTAMRISIADMFYVEPVFFKENYYIGGAIDLLPIELAKSLAENIICEKKGGYSSMEEGLIRAVFGYSGNQRLAEVSGLADYEINTSDVNQALDGHYCKKFIDWRKFQVAITLPTSHKQFAEDMEIQWQYGYNKGKQIMK